MKYTSNDLKKIFFYSNGILYWRISGKSITKGAPEDVEKLVAAKRKELHGEFARQS